jgi:hypothetical protein
MSAAAEECQFRMNTDDPIGFTNAAADSISMTMMTRHLGVPLPMLLIHLVLIPRILVTKMTTVFWKHVTPLDLNLMGGKGLSIGQQF